MDKSSLIADAFSHSPTQEQMQFCRKAADFLSSDKSASCLILKGYAGTGKTTSVAALVKTLAHFRMKPVLLAPTGRAAKVMSTYTQLPAFTIHKKIYRRKSAVDPAMTFQLAPNLLKNALFIVDEASMIADEWNQALGSSFLDDLICYVFQKGNEGEDKACKLLLVGDTAQLPPVGSEESPALDKMYLQRKYGLETEMVELREVVRQKEKSGILSNATMLRKLIFKDESPIKLPRFRFKNYKDVFRMNGIRMVEGLEYAYHQFGIDRTLVVCRSNKAANQYNQQIRTRLLYREEELSGGDQLMVVKNNYFWLNPEEESGFIANGDLATVISVRGEEERYGLRFATVHLNFPDFQEMSTLTCKVILDTLQTDSAQLTTHQQEQLYLGLQEDYAFIDNKRERLQAIKSDPYFNALQIKFAYAVTCHKAQGGQWDAVFVDQGFLTEDKVDLNFLRWLYTAVTRARLQLFLVNFSPKLFAETNEDDSFESL